MPAKKEQSFKAAATPRPCWNCKETKPVTDEFFHRNGSTRGLSYECKLCRRHKQRIRHKKLIAGKQQFVIDRGCRCSHCGVHNFNPSFFEIDHIVPIRITKVPRVPQLKYDDQRHQVLCPNCHKLKTIEDNKS